MNTGKHNTSKLEVIIPVKDRVEVMPCVQSLIQSVGIAKVIVCDGGSSDSRCLKTLHELERYNKVQVLRFPAPGFNKSRLINQGIAQSTTNFLLISDADIIWNEAALDAVLNKVTSDSPTICCVRDVKESKACSVALKRDRYTYKVRVNDDVAFVDVVPVSNRKSTSLRPGCGLICARRTTLIALGGYKEIFTGWGWEDQDLLIRASLFGIQVTTDGQVMHLSHDDTARNRHCDNIEPVQTRNRNIIASLKSLAEGVLLGALCMKVAIKPRAKLIHVRLPESLKN